MSEPPNAQARQRVAVRRRRRWRRTAGSSQVVAGDADQPQTHHQHAVIAPPRKRHAERGIQASWRLCAVRTLARTEMSCPM